MANLSSDSGFINIRHKYIHSKRFTILMGILFLIMLTFILSFSMSIQLTNSAYPDPQDQLSIINKRIGDVRDELNRTSEALSLNDTELASFHVSFAEKQLQLLQEYANITSARSLNDTLEQRNITNN
jgi:hypothetical protein